MDQPRPAQPHQPDDEPQRTPTSAGPRNGSVRSLAEKIGLVALGQVMAYLLHRAFD